MIPDQNVLALSWKIAVQPNLQRTLVTNPYSPRTSQIVQEIFPDSDSSIIIQAAVLAEPEGRYDRYYKLLPLWMQEAEQRNQISKSGQIIVDLNKYYLLNAEEFRSLKSDFLYDILFQIAFQSCNLEEITQKFSRQQRIELRFLIIWYVTKSLKEATYNHYQPSPTDERKLEASSSNRPKFMPSKKSALTLIYLSPSILLALFLTNNFYPKPNNEVEFRKSSYSNTYQPAGASEGFPVRLQIPRIHVDAGIEYVGINKQGEMEVPYNVTKVGWYKLGPKPGENGSAVISGHLDVKKGEFGAFNNLSKLKRGDQLFVQDGTGKILSFLVQGSKTYTPGYADEVFMPEDNFAHLNLVSCEGVWDGAKKSYSQRLVVFATASDINLPN